MSPTTEMVPCQLSDCPGILNGDLVCSVCLLDWSCAWCVGEQIQGNRSDPGRPMTIEEMKGGFFATHLECREKMDQLFADLAARSVFVTVSEGQEGCR